MSAKPIIDRRRHRVYLTKNTEYHTRDNRCVAIRDRATRLWIWEHKALWARVLGGVSFLNGGIRPTAGVPNIGESLYLHRTDGEDLITSQLEDVGRPEPHIVDIYPSFAA
jgi:hypothetical protein